MPSTARGDAPQATDERNPSIRACRYLSATTLAGLVVNAAFGVWWASPIAALVIVVFLVREAREAWEGRRTRIDAPFKG